MIKKNKVVSLQYLLTDDSGKELDRSTSAEPFTYLHGAGQIVPGLESALEGMKKGEKGKVTVDPADGYGDMDPQLRLTVGRDVFPEDVDPQPGMRFAADVGNGQEAVFTVLSVNDDEVNVDGNHPLAGVRLHFDVEILDLRDATEEELSHGHAHGPHGHSH